MVLSCLLRLAGCSGPVQQPSLRARPGAGVSIPLFARGGRRGGITHSPVTAAAQALSGRSGTQLPKTTRPGRAACR